MPPVDLEANTPATAAPATVSLSEPERTALLARRVDTIEWSIRTAGALETAGIVTLRDLATQTEDELLRHANFGRKSLKEVREILAEMGLTIGMKPDAGG